MEQLNRKTKRWTTTMTNGCAAYMSPTATGAVVAHERSCPAEGGGGGGVWEWGSPAAGLHLQWPQPSRHLQAGLIYMQAELRGIQINRSPGGAEPPPKPHRRRQRAREMDKRTGLDWPFRSFLPAQINELLQYFLLKKLRNHFMHARNVACCWWKPAQTILMCP